MRVLALSTNEDIFGAHIPQTLTYIHKVSTLKHIQDAKTFRLLAQIRRGVERHSRHKRTKYLYQKHGVH
jgi:hypothetical protein